MKPVQRFNLLYTIHKPLVCYGARCHYRTFTVKGRDNLPKDGGYMLAPCHQQALMEPLAVLAVTHKPTVFLARADIFANPTIRELLFFLKIMPVYRIRDGKENLGKNAEIFEASRQVVLDGFPFCMMAEGRHNDKHQLLPLVKGMFRIAGETQKSLGDTPLYIVPVGIDFDEYEEPFSNLCINIGKPIPVQQYMATFVENEPVALNQMREAVADGIRRQMFDIRSREHYGEILTVCDMTQRRTAWQRFEERQARAQRLDTMEAAADPQWEPLMDKVHQYQSLTRKHGVSTKVEARHYSLIALLLSLIGVAAVVAGVAMCKPCLMAVLFLLACYPMAVLPTHLLMPKLIKDTQFRSSVNYGIRLFVSYLYTIVFALVMGFTGGGVWGDMLTGIAGVWWALAVVVAALVAARLSGVVTVWLRHTWRSLTYWTKRMLHGADFKSMRSLRKQITNAL